MSLFELKSHKQLNHIIYLYFLDRYKQIDTNFMDSLVHIYRLIKMETDSKIDKLFISLDFKIIDPDMDRILQSLIFIGYINKNHQLTEQGMTYLHSEKQKNAFINHIFDLFERKYLNKMAYEDTCLVHNLPTSANCGLCTDMQCAKKASIASIIPQLLKLSNYTKSYSKS